MSFDASAPLSSDALDALLDQAFDALEQGDLALARQHFQSVLAASPDEFDALNMLGVIALQSGELANAAQWFQRAIAADPQAGMAHTHLGLTLMQSQQTEAALPHLQRGAALEPTTEALFSLATALAALGQHEAALAQFDAVLQQQPQHTEALFGRGNACLVLQRWMDAAQSYTLVLAQQPDNVSALINRGMAWHALERHQEAVADHDRALTLDRRRVAAWCGRGDALRAMGRMTDAWMNFDQAAKLQPGRADILARRGATAHHLKRLPQAIADYREALAAKADDPVTWSNLSGALRDARQPQEALGCADRAIALDDELVGAHTNRGNALQDLGRPAEAEGAFARSLQLNPLDQDVQWAQGWCWLLQGDWERGLPRFEVRWSRPGRSVQPRGLSKPVWLGQGDLQGRTVLLHAEQGLGDTLQFARYAPLVAARGARVLLEVQPPLVGLMRSLDGVEAVLPAGEPLPDFDLHCPLMSLPLAFGARPDAVHAPASYLRAPATQVSVLSARLGPKDRPRVGLVWSGNTAHVNDANRSIALQLLMSALPAGAQYVCLQRDVRDSDRATLAANPQILHLGDVSETFEGTAALTELMDLVVSVDTSVAHLAGALGRPTWVLLPKQSDWRWLMERDDSPWYPQARLIRQTRVGDWGEALAQLRAQLQDWLAR